MLEGMMWGKTTIQSYNWIVKRKSVQMSYASFQSGGDPGQNEEN